MDDRSNLGHPARKGSGTNLLFLLILLIVVGGLALWGYLDTPPEAPNPTSTALPDAMPESAPQTSTPTS